MCDELNAREVLRDELNGSCVDGWRNCVTIDQALLEEWPTPCTLGTVSCYK